MSVHQDPSPAAAEHPARVRDCGKAASKLYVCGIASSLVMLVGIVLWLAVYVPSFAQATGEFGVRQSRLAAFAFQTSDWFRGARPGQAFPGWIGVVPLSLVAIIVAALVGRHERARPAVGMILVLFSLVALLALAMAHAGFYLMTLSINESLRGGKL